jgi:hypothetical protein
MPDSKETPNTPPHGPGTLLAGFASPGRIERHWKRRNAQASTHLTCSPSEAQGPTAPFHSGGERSPNARWSKQGSEDPFLLSLTTSLPLAIQPSCVASANLGQLTPWITISWLLLHFGHLKRTLATPGLICMLVTLVST